MNSSGTLDLPVVIIGAGGHARVLLDLLNACGRPVAGVCDPLLCARGQSEWNGVPVLGGDEALESLSMQMTTLANGVGQQVRDEGRRHLYGRLRRAGFRFPVLVHPWAWVSPAAHLNDGVQVMAGAVIQANAFVGSNTIVNTRASIDHDCRVGAHVHIAPGATLCGSVVVEDGAFIGAGSTVVQGLTIGAGAVLGAGTTLTRDLAPGALSVGASLRVDSV